MLPKKSVIAFILSSVGLSLIGCSSCVNAGFCKIAPDEKTVSAIHSGTVLISPGETKRIKLELKRTDGSAPSIGEGETFTFGTSQASAQVRTDNTLYLWADEQVKVSWDGVPFKKDNAYVTISATENAYQPLPNDINNGSTGATANYVYIQATDAKTVRAGPLNIFIQVAE